LVFRQQKLEKVMDQEGLADEDVSVYTIGKTTAADAENTCKILT